jgi:hypothetical protein
MADTVKRFFVESNCAKALLKAASRLGHFKHRITYSLRYAKDFCRNFLKILDIMDIFNKKSLDFICNVPI